MAVRESGGLLGVGRGWLARRRCLRAGRRESDGDYRRGICAIVVGLAYAGDEDVQGVGEEDAW